MTKHGRVQVAYTAISIYVVRSKLQGYGTRPKGGMGRLELILGFRGCRREMDMEAENTISIALRVLTKSNKNRYDSYDSPYSPSLLSCRLEALIQQRKLK